MTIDYKNLDEIHIDQIDSWLGYHNDNNPDIHIRNEEKVFEFFNTYINNKIQFNDRSRSTAKKNSLDSAYNALKAISNLDPFYKRKYEESIKIITEGLTYDIQELESRQEKGSLIKQGQVLEVMLCVKAWEDLTNRQVDYNSDVGFNSFITLLYQLRDPSYIPKNHNTLIGRAIGMKERLENNLDKNS